MVFFFRIISKFLKTPLRDGKDRNKIIDKTLPKSNIIKQQQYSKWGFRSFNQFLIQHRIPSLCICLSKVNGRRARQMENLIFCMSILNLLFYLAIHQVMWGIILWHKIQIQGSLTISWLCIVILILTCSMLNGKFLF